MHVNRDDLTKRNNQLDNHSAKVLNDDKDKVRYGGIWYPLRGDSCKLPDGSTPRKS